MRGPVQSVFASYERGAEPPFATPGVNSVLLGYRLQWAGWQGQLR
jgi:hypothetical protein